MPDLLDFTAVGPSRVAQLAYGAGLFFVVVLWVAGVRYGIRTSAGNLAAAVVVGGVAAVAVLVVFQALLRRLVGGLVRGER